MITEIIGSVLNIVDKFVPDPKIKQQIEQEVRNIDFEKYKIIADVDKEQAKVNAIEAKSSNLFKSGWRPSVGWTCVLGLFYSFVFKPVMGFFIVLYAFHYDIDISHIPPLPSLNMNELMSLLGGVLGLGAYRTYEKSKGKD